MKFLTGKDYPDLCKKCRTIIDHISDFIIPEGPDTDDVEAPCNYVYDHNLFCGGFECLNEEEVLSEPV